MRKLFFAIFCLIVLPSVSLASDIAVSPSGTGDGSDWSNPMGWTGIAFVRGNTYYLAEGSYASKTLSTAVSGTTLITIKKATAAAHGPSLNWVDSMGDGQTSFASLVFSSSYWEVDGVSRNESNWQQSANYGFKITDKTYGDTDPYIELSGSISNITIKYMDIGGSGEPPDPAKNVGVKMVDTASPYRSNVTLQRVHIHNMNIPIQSRQTGSVTLEYSYIGPSWGKEAISAQYGGEWIVRWSKFIDSCVTPSPNWDVPAEGCTAPIAVFDYNGNDPADVDAPNWEIYGNVFAETGTYTGTKADALIELNATDGGWKIWNNTIAHTDGTYSGALLFKSALSTGNSIKNNLWYWMGDYNTDPAYGGMVIADNTAGVSSGYSWCYYKNPNPARSGYDCSNLPNDNRYTGTEDPFTDEPNKDYTLKSSFAGVSPVDKGENLGSSPYNADMLGNTRGSDGSWDIGAYEYVVGSAPSADIIFHSVRP